MKRILYETISHETLLEDKEIILTDKYLFYTCEEAIKGKEVTIMPVTYRDKESLMTAYEYISDFAARIIDTLVKNIQQIHGARFSKSWVRLVYGDFLLEVIYDAYSCFQKIEAIDIKDVYYVGKREREVIKPVKVVSGKGIQDNEFHAYLYESLFDFLGIKNEGYKSKAYREEMQKEDFFRKIYHRGQGCLESFRVWKSIYKKRKSHSLLTVSFFPKKIEQRIVESTRGKVYALPRSLFLHYDMKNFRIKDPDFQKRFQLFDGVKAKNTFERFLLSFLPNTVPLALCENFSFMYKDAQKLSRQFIADKVYNSESNSVMMMMFLANKEKEGTRVIRVQNSGSSMYNLQSLYLDGNIFKEFATWGWKDNDPWIKTYPVVTQRLSNISQMACRAEIKEILVVVDAYSGWDNMMGSLGTDYIDRHFAFVNNLNDNLKSKVTVRTRWSFLPFKEIYARQYPDIKLETSFMRPIEESIERSDLIVCDHISSALFEALMTGKPTVAFDGINTFMKRPCFVEWESKLEAVGIYNVDGAKMANMLNEGADDLVRDWNDAKRQAVIADFLSYFTGYGKNLVEEWEKEYLS